MAKGHYIPKTYLRKFVDKSLDSEKTWQIIKTQREIIKEVMIDNICKKSNLYLLKSFTEKKDREFIERTIYSDRIEQEYNDAYNMLIDPLKVQISKDDKELLLISILSLYFRHYDNLKSINNKVQNDIENISKYLNERKSNKKITKGNISLDFNTP